MVVNELSFDPRHAWCPVPGLDDIEWTLEIFTVEDVRLLDATQTTLTANSVTCEGLMQPGMQRAMTGRVTVALQQDGPSVSWRVRAQTDLPIKAVKLLFRGLPTDEAQGWWTPTTPRDTALQPSPATPITLRYPWPSWQTPWISCGEGPGITLSVRDTVVAAKRFYTFLPPWSASPVVEIVCDQSAWNTSTSYAVPEIRLTTCADQVAVQQDLRAHLAHLQSAYGLVPWGERTDVPKWADGIRTVVTLHGQHWTGHVFNTFDEMCHILREVTRHIPGDQVLAYLPGWEGRYY